MLKPKSNIKTKLRFSIPKSRDNDDMNINKLFKDLLPINMLKNFDDDTE